MKFVSFSKKVTICYKKPFLWMNRAIKTYEWTLFTNKVCDFVFWVVSVLINVKTIQTETGFLKILLAILMFSSKDSLKRRTPKIGINREHYIQLLVDEYYETTDLGTYFDEFSWVFVSATYSSFLFNRGQRTSHGKPSEFRIRSHQLRVSEEGESVWSVFGALGTRESGVSHARNNGFM